MSSLNKRLEIVDISPLAKNSDNDYDDAASKLYSALSEIGFAVIINHEKLGECLDFHSFRILISRFLLQLPTGFTET